MHFHSYILFPAFSSESLQKLVNPTKYVFQPQLKSGLGFHLYQVSAEGNIHAETISTIISLKYVAWRKNDALNSCEQHFKSSQAPFGISIIASTSQTERTVSVIFSWLNQILSF